MERWEVETWEPSKELITESGELLLLPKLAITALLESIVEIQADHIHGVIPSCFV
jgi:hypothetical protein